jgi:hypothetical protein
MDLLKGIEMVESLESFAPGSRKSLTPPGKSSRENAF